jgi:hypothetical protein
MTRLSHPCPRRLCEAVSTAQQLAEFCPGLVAGGFITGCHIVQQWLEDFQ